MGVFVRPEVYILFIFGKSEKAWPGPVGGGCVVLCCVWMYGVEWFTVVYTEVHLARAAGAVYMHVNRSVNMGANVPTL